LPLPTYEHYLIKIFNKLEKQLTLKMKLMKDYLNKKLGDGEGRLHSSAEFTSTQIKPASAGLVLEFRLIAIAK
jgi:hypothetical protein